MVIREYVNGNIYYDNQMSRVTKISGTEDALPNDKQDASTPTVYENSIAEFFNSVKADAVKIPLDENGEPAFTAEWPE